MRHLPPLVSGACRCAIPLADHSAAVLVEFLLSERKEQSKFLLAKLLSEDPLLLLWTVCVSYQCGGFQPQNVGEAAEWLAGHIDSVLLWTEGEEDIVISTGVEKWADRVAEVFQVAETAALLSSAGDVAVADRAWLHGLLCDAARWLDDCRLPPIAPPCPFLPDWLANIDLKADAACAAVQWARELLEDGDASSPHPSPLPEGVGTFKVDTIFDRAACQMRAQVIRERWLAAGEQLGDYLPRLTRLLSRLSALENNFQKLLEAEKLQALAEFAAGAGHEINNPLTVIAGRAQLFLQEETDSERRRALALMNSQAMRIYEMIADLMLFARPPQPNFALVDVAKIVDELLADIQLAAIDQETEFIRSGQPGPLEIEADAAQLSVAVRALCQNSLEALGHGGQMEIELQSTPAEIMIHVKDNGPGITPDQRNHIFDPFYSARQAGRGLGLGLSKCWRIVTNHNGRIDVSSTPGQATEFVITLPRKQSRKAERGG